jgi:hypothetical protein
MLPLTLELINIKRFSFNAVVIPYSLGAIVFILVGLFYFAKSNHAYTLFKSKLIMPISIMIIAIIFASFFGDSFINDFMRSGAISIIYLASLGWIVYLNKFEAHQWLNYTMIAMFIYWLIYTISVTIVGGDVISYSGGYNDEGLYNHHIPGMGITVSGFFIIGKILDKGINLRNYIKIGLIVFVIVICTILLESRSNLLMTILLLFVIFTDFRRVKFSTFILRISIIILMFSLTMNFVSSFDHLKHRFGRSISEQIDSDYNRVAVYTQFLPNMVTKPFGSGITKPNLEITNKGYNQKMLPHNQYLYLIRVGGLFAVYGTIFLLVLCFRLFKYQFISRRKYYQALNGNLRYSYVLPVLCFFLTLFTIESMGVMFFLLFAILINLTVKTTSKNRALSGFNRSNLLKK